jgi:hypothetical protein
LLAVAFIVAQANADDEIENLLLNNPSFEQDYQGWWQQNAAGAVYKTDEDAIDGDKCAHAEVIAVTGTDWHSGMTNSGLILEQGETYTVDFFAKASATRIITLEVKVASPYEWIAETDMTITEEWAEYSHTFTPAKDYPGNAQVAFWIGHVKGDVWLDGVRAYEGPKQEREEEEPDISVQAKDKLVTAWAAIRASY